MGFKPLPLYSTANDPETANDPQNGPQMILDRKWSQKKYKNGLDSSLRIIVLILLLLLQQVTLKAKFCLVTFSKLSLKQ